jgi:hypothetical protein
MWGLNERKPENAAIVALCAVEHIKLPGKCVQYCTESRAEEFRIAHAV